MSMCNFHKTKAILYFENGVSFSCNSFGASGTIAGEVVFNTSMTGYQEITSDPSYAGQFITFCMPQIGNVGANELDMESSGIFANGVIAKEYDNNYSNFRATESFASFLKRHNKMGICDIDTRAIVSMLRDNGALMAVMSTQEFDKQKLQSILDKTPSMDDINFNEQVSTKKPYIYKSDIELIRDKPFKNKILAIDFGIKKNILNELVNVNLEVEVIPYDFDADDIIKRFDAREISGVFLSNGPGNPLILKDTISFKIQQLIEHNIPMFGICFGHQILSIAHGFDTYKLKFGHHGGNHPIINADNKVEITSQNHIYNIPDAITNKADVIARNLFDNTIEGVRYKNNPIMSIQYHPESNPGPEDSKSLFARFADML